MGVIGKRSSGTGMISIAPNAAGKLSLQPVTSSTSNSASAAAGMVSSNPSTSSVSTSRPIIFAQPRVSTGKRQRRHSMSNEDSKDSMIMPSNQTSTTGDGYRSAAAMILPQHPRSILPNNQRPPQHPPSVPTGVGTGSGSAPNLSWMGIVAAAAADAQHDTTTTSSFASFSPEQLQRLVLLQQQQQRTATPTPPPPQSVPSSSTSAIAIDDAMDHDHPDQWS